MPNEANLVNRRAYPSNIFPTIMSFNEVKQKIAVISAQCSNFHLHISQTKMKSYESNTDISIKLYLKDIRIEYEKAETNSI